MATGNPGGQAAEAGDGLRWFAMRTLPQREMMAAKVLRLDGLIAEVKTEQRLRRQTKWDKERRYMTFNAAPGYIFIAVPGKDPRRYVRPLHIFRSFVGDKEGRPLELPPHTRLSLSSSGAIKMKEGLLNFLQLEQGGLPGYYRHFRTGREFKIGDTVIVNTGPFRDQQVKVEAVDDGEAMFFMRLLGQNHEVRVSVHDCIPVEAAA